LLSFTVPLIIGSPDESAFLVVVACEVNCKVELFVLLLDIVEFCCGVAADDVPQIVIINTNAKTKSINCL